MTGSNGIESDHTNGTNGHTNGHTTVHTSGYTNGHTNGTATLTTEPSTPRFEPIAICGMACRLPGGVSSPKELWSFLLSGQDGRIITPKSRFNIDGYYSATKRAGTTNTKYGYFLDESVDLAGLDTSMFSVSRMEVEWLDPQQRMMLEVARECVDDAGEVGWRGSKIGVYIGSFGQDWYDILNRDGLRHSVVSVIASHDFMISERISHEMDLKGPSMTLRTACSSALVGLNEACMAIAKGDCESAIVGGSNLILAPDLVTRLSDQGILSPDGSCKTFSAEANGYARGEAIVSIYIKSLSAALRDGNPIRSVITGSASNFDGRTNPLTTPSATSQEALIRRTYEVAGISDFSKTGLFECHGTGTATGDPIEAEAIAKVFGDKGVYLGAIKPNVGHSEGASGLTAVLKATLALEHRTIPPNIKYAPLNPKIPFEQANLRIPEQPTPWPAGRDERVSINSFGVGGSNAHVIVESAESFFASRGATVTAQPEAEADDKPQLLVFSANTAQSLKEMVAGYQSLLLGGGESSSINLADLAYTLANRREHLPHRSFAIASKDKFELPASVPNASTSSSSQTPSLVMVFTGQGAASPQMSRDLLLSNETYANSIKSLDRRLRSLGADWSLEEELLKPTRTSRVYEAEFAQPLSTALQIALVDTLAAAGIKPSAVVGHSSGEIVAAYAAGALTAQEAIAVAYHRGATARAQTAPGGMAAVGLGWEQVQEFLTEGVVAACDNSPNSVTLSGDADQLEVVVAEINKAHPDVSTTMLKVGKAYHSHHMLALGPDYHRAMTESGVVGTTPSIPFFSSVRGSQLLGDTKADRLGPDYWRANLERPVLFRAAVTEILRAKQQFKNPVLLEIGPHSALAGPLRQTLASESSKATYIPTLTRRQNSVENLLQAIGKLYTLNVPIDFKSLVPAGSVVSDLPRYPWDHSRRFWFESRVAKAWREREYADHTLLGARVPESTDLEPVWRNFLSVETTPWVVDHKIGESIVFPLAGYVSIAGEAARQVSGIDDGASFKEVAVNTALVLDEETPTEIVTTLRKHRLTDTLSSKWWEFHISSYNGHSWTKHCSGQVRGEALPDTGLEDDDQVWARQEPPLPRKVDGPRWYESAAKEGLVYGPNFATMDQIRSSTGWPHRATAIMRNNRWGDEAQYHLHPIILDTWFQLMSCAVNDGIGHAYRRLVASRVENLTIYRSAVDQLDLNVTCWPTDAGYVGEGNVTANGKTVLRNRRSHASLFQEVDASEDKSIPITARCQWVPHVDFQQDLYKLIKPSQGHVQFGPVLADLAQLTIDLASKIAQGIDVHETAGHLSKYKTWLHQTASANNADEPETITLRINSLLGALEGTSAEGAARAIVAVSGDMEALLRGGKSGLEILTTDGRLDALTKFLSDADDLDYILCVANSQPNLRVLEVGAGTGERASLILATLTHEDGHPLYSQYVVADPSSGLLNSARARLSDTVNTEFLVLDLNKDLAEQGLDGRQFDLILASNVLNASTNIAASLRSLHGLLSPRGRLLLEEPRPGLTWAKFALAVLPGYWSYASDLDRVEEPFLGETGWQEALATAGFDDVASVGFASEHAANSVLVAKPRASKTPSKRITLLSDSNAEPILVVEELKKRGYEVDRCSLGGVPPADQDVLALLEEEGPFFTNIDSVKLSEFRSFVGSLDNAGLLWVTRPSNVGCTDPRYAQVIGLARVLRAEMEVALGTLELEKVSSPGDAVRVVDVVAHFQGREKDGAMGPDYEYAIHDDQMLVNRIFPFSLEKELLTSDASEEAVLTQTDPGRLNTLTWSTKQVQPPKEDEIELEVYASGLNFRDVLVGMQIIPGRHEPKFGYEAAGIVKRVGANVTKLRPGDRAVVIGTNTFTTTLTGHQVYYEKLPDHLSFIEGACIPTIFVTAVYGLMDLGHLSKGKSVLIHSGAGGVGLAAIQVARMLGAEIYTTVGSETKVRYLMDTFDIPRNRIFNSRNASFVDDLLRETGGKGVDVALNSLSGELLHATWKCVAKWGTMVEIGKRDLLGNATLEMAPFLANRNYCCLDVDQMRSERPEMSSRLLKFTMECFDKGTFKPIRVDRVFDGPSVLDAFRYMQQGKHIGKIVLEIRDGVEGKLLVTDVDSTKRARLQLDETGSYLLVGGLGGLGRSISVWMVQHGARHITYLSRSAGRGKHDADFVREIESMGCTVNLVAGDVSKADDVARAIDAANATAVLKGIVQMSMVLRDQMFEGMSIEDWNTVTAPKVQGTWNLHEITATRGIDLDFFLLFSSLSGILGQIGQANYASANTFLDAFVQYRASVGLPATAIDLGAMEGVGYLSENQELLRKMQGTGWRPVQEVELLNALELGMKPTSTNTFLLGVAPSIPLSHPESSARLRRDARLAAYHNIGGGASQASSSATDGLRAFLGAIKKDPSALQSPETAELLATEIGKKLFGLLLLGNQEVDIKMSTADMGLDSLVSIELRAWWKLTFGFEISTLEMLSLGTLEALGKRAVDGLIQLYGA